MTNLYTFQIDNQNIQGIKFGFSVGNLFEFSLGFSLSQKNLEFG